MPGANRPSTQPPKPPPTSRAPQAPASRSRATVGLDRGRGDLIQVAQAGVGCVEQRSEPRQVAHAQRRDGCTHALVLPEHVLRAAAQRLGQLRHVGHGRFAEQGDLEQLARPRALGATLVVAAARMRVTLVGVEHDQAPVPEQQRHGLDLQAREVDAQRRVGTTEQRCELVEQPRVRADPVVLHARAQSREVEPRERRARPGRAVDAVAQCEQREAQRDLDGGRG